MHKISKRLTNSFVTALVSLLFISSFVSVQAAVTKPIFNWQDTALTVGKLTSADVCPDTTRPDTLLVNDRAQGGTFALNWRTGHATQITDRFFNYCGPNGLLFASDGAKTIRYSLDEPQGRTVEHLPSQSAQDGTNWVYALDKGQLWASANGGLNWLARPIPPGGNLLSFAVAAQAQAVYAAVSPTPADQKTLSYDLYFSSDGGQSWELRVAKRKAKATDAGLPQIQLATFGTTLAPLDYVKLTVDSGGTGQNTSATVYVSSDGGRTFNDAGQNKSIFERVQVFYVQGGLLRFRSTESQKYTLTFSVDGGAAWLKRDLPLSPKPVTDAALVTTLMQVGNLPANLLLSDTTGLFYSPDGGLSWQNLGNRYAPVIATPYAPLALLGYDSTTKKLYSLTLPDAAKSSINGTPATGGSDTAYFDTTHHNLSGAFRVYWEQNGGLAQFGYPKTEPFREVNASDGRVYLVQYFERNRFELHPENAGTPYEVLLGLLGNQLTETRRAKGETPFNRAADLHAGNGTYFEATGHNLRGVFKTYWEAHGGLALYGYPTSEEFAEVNPDDGQTYEVQYFERNRFEYHPNNAGTPYEVLLGLLGNTLLKQKGWL